MMNEQTASEQRHSRSITSKRKHKPLKLVLIVLGVLGILLLLSFIPTLNPNTGAMKTIEGEYITVFYEQEEAAARDVFAVLNSESSRITDALGFDSPQNICVYIYDKQATFKTKKYGLIALALNLDWYVGDNQGTNVLLASPANPGSQHSYDEICQDISVHEMVHAYSFLVNKDMSLWLKEGLAVYLSVQVPTYKVYNELTNSIPTMQQMRTSNPIEFSDMGGYEYSYTYLEFLNDTYGWECVLALAQSNDCIAALGAEESVVYGRWVEFVRTKY